MRNFTFIIVVILLFPFFGNNYWFLEYFLNSKGQIPEKTQGFILGINGHPLSQAAYKEFPVAEQMQLLKSMKMTYYRFDGGTDYKGQLKDEPRFAGLTREAKKHTIKLLPVLWLRGLDTMKTEPAAYERGFIEGSGFASRYGDHFDYYELGNEQDLKVLKQRSLSGKETTDYKIDKTKILASFFRGMHHGIKKADTGSKTIIDMTEGHYGFFKLLKQYNVQFDVIGIHWYSKVDFASSKLPRIINETAEVFNGEKPVWITEFNSQFGSYGGREDFQELIVSQFVEQSRFIQGVEALFIYELLDEPRLIHPKETEKTFGIVKWITPHTKWEYKKAGKSLRDTELR